MPHNKRQRSEVNLLVTKNRDDGTGLAYPVLMQVIPSLVHISGCMTHRNRNNAPLRHLPVAFRPRGCHKRRHLSARGGMAVGGGGPTHAPVIAGTPGTLLFHRFETPTQDRAVAAQQVTSMEVWGAPARGSSLPSVKAYRNALPARRGIEFCTTISPTAGRGTPYEARWYLGDSGVISRQGSSYAAVPIYYIKNTQVP